MTSDDCADKARCPDVDAPAMTSDATQAAHDAAVAEASDEAADDEAAAVDATTTADDASDEVSVDATAEDVTSADSPADAEDSGDDGPSTDGASPDSADAAPEASADGATADGPTACDARNPDCSNPSCHPAFSCIPAVPAGWTGPVVLFDANSAAAPAPAASPCPTTPQYANDAFDGHANPFPQGACTCTCGAANGACSGPTVTVFQDGQCGTSCAVVTNVSSCAKGCASSNALSAKVTAGPAPTGGSCPSSLANTLAPWNVASGWTTTGRACGASRTVIQGGCAASQVCADAPPAATLQAWCIYQAGSVSCPAEYPQQHVYFAGGTDGRACTGTCSCGGPTGVTCTINSVSVSATTDCAAPATFASTTVGQCNGNLAATARNVTASVSASGGQCAASGNAAVTGAIAPSAPTTVCCAASP